MVRKLDLHESATFFYHSPVLGIMGIRNNPDGKFFHLDPLSRSRTAFTAFFQNFIFSQLEFFPDEEERFGSGNRDVKTTF